MVNHMDDTQQSDITEYFYSTFKFIEEGRKKGNVFVHCFFGQSRSATIVLNYMIGKYDMSYEDAFDFLKQKRPYVKPNASFEEALKKKWCKNVEAVNQE